MSDAERKVGDPFPPNFTIIYDPNLLYRLTSEIIDTKTDEGSEYTLFQLSQTGIGNPFVGNERTNLAVGRQSTIIKSRIQIGRDRAKSPHGYVSTEEVKKIQSSLRARNVESHTKPVRGKNMIYIPRKADSFIYMQADMGYPSVDEMRKFFKEADADTKIRLTTSEKGKRRMVICGDIENKEINLTLIAENIWIKNPHFGPRIFDFYFTHYEDILRALLQVKDLSLPRAPIHIEPRALRAED